jgi:hypothetical protein
MKAAFSTKLTVQSVHLAARWTAQLKLGAALQAKFGAFRITRAAFYTQHGFYSPLIKLLR